MEIAPARLTSLGDVPIRRALPGQGRRTVGPWCFCDHLGPFEATGSQGMRFGPRTDSAPVGVDLSARPGRVELPLNPAFEHPMVALDGAPAVEAESQSAAGEPAVLSPGRSGYLGPSRDYLVIECREPTRALLLGGEPFAETVSMWWNFVARTHNEIDAAAEDWQRSSDRFGGVVSPLPRVPAPGRPWARQ